MTVPWLPLSSARLLPSEADWLPERWREMAIEMMAAPFTSPRTAVVIGRSGGPAFRRSELLRLGPVGRGSGWGRGEVLVGAGSFKKKNDTSRGRSVSR